jgi:hypothetical protein
MQPIAKAWCVQIDVTNYCSRACLYCSRYNRHLRRDQRRHMTLAQVGAALNTLKTWPGKIGIIGGEPLMHPEFRGICELILGTFPPEKMGLWTSGGRNYQPLLPLIKQTFGFVAYNEHNEQQLNTCKHQPLTVAIKDAIPDAALRKALIDDCWVQRTWCPTINHFGAYFCEVAAAQDVLLNEGRHAWPVAPGWWKKEPSQFADQVERFCDNCGMAIPMERELIKSKTEKFSPGLLEAFRQRQLSRVSEHDVSLFGHQFSKGEIVQNIPNWTPGNYRGDLQEDQAAPEGKGFTQKL